MDSCLGVANYCCSRLPCRWYLPSAVLPEWGGREEGNGRRSEVSGQGDIDRVIDAARRETVDGLFRFAEKLYRRNPRELKLGPSPTMEAALKRLRAARRRWISRTRRPPRRRGGDARLREDYTGDRVLALMAGLLMMVYSAFEDKDDFYILDDLNEQKLYNCARNLEIAMWKLFTAKYPDGTLMLLSNELDPANRNLSFEREFGRITGCSIFWPRLSPTSMVASFARRAEHGHCRLPAGRCPGIR